MRPDAQPFVSHSSENKFIANKSSPPASILVDYVVDEPVIQPAYPASFPDMSSLVMSHDELTSLNQSLCQALVKERETNLKTKTALKAALAEVQALKGKNTTLKATSLMLQAIVKHHAKQLIYSSIDPIERPLPSKKNLQTAARDFFAKTRAMNNEKKPFICDTLAAQREDHEKMGYLGGSDIDATSASKLARQEELTIFDLSKISDSSQEHAELSEAQLAVLRKVSTISDSRKGDLLQTPQSSAQRSEILNTERMVEISPPTSKLSVPLNSTHNRNQTASLNERGPHQRLTVANVEKLESPEYNLKNENMGDPDKTPTKVPRLVASVAQLSETPMLTLPASFLDKWGANKRLVTAEAAVLPLTSPSVSSQSAFEPAKVTRSSAPFNSKSARDYELTMIPDPYDPTIHWVMHSNKPVFEDEGEMSSARLQNINKSSHFWEHPVRYLPSHAEQNLYRTVMIDFIPLNSTYQDVLAHIRTGPLESIQLLPRIGRSNNFLTARVVFHTELAAFRFGRAHDAGYGGNFKIHGKNLRVWQVLQPTYPASRTVEEDVFKHGYTRLMLLINTKAEVLARLHEKIALEIARGEVIKIGRAHDGEPLVEFTSVRAAGDAFRKLQMDPEFKDTVFDFEEDYCNGIMGAVGPV